MKSRIFILSIVFIIPIVLNGQTLTQKQVLEDFNQFENFINDYYSAKRLVEQRTQTNIAEELKLLRKECCSIKTDSEFVDIIFKSLNTLCDKHASIVNSSVVKMYVTQFQGLSSFGKIKLADTLNAEHFYNIAYSNKMSKMKCGIRAKYINGEYFISRSFQYNGVVVDSGERISAINGIPVSKYVEQNKLKLFNLAWDEKNKIWYSELFWLNNEIIKENKFKLTIGQKEVELDCDVTVNITKRVQKFSTSPLVTLLDSNILFVRIPIMQNYEWYINQIISHYNQNIKKVILDIRGNGGGQDEVWQEILSVLIGETFYIKTIISMNNNASIRKILPLYNLKEPQIISFDTIFPQSNNINFKGSIYILQDIDTYSAASGLASLAFQKEEIILMGQPISFIGGRGLTPLIFKLDNSGIVFRIPFTTDLSGGLINPYMNKVEIEIPLSLESYFETIYENPYEVQFLNNKDKLIEYVRKQ